MGARVKLNPVFSLGSLLVATMVGLLAKSWALFWLVLIGTMAFCYEAGGIRHRPNGRRPRLGG